MKTRFTELVGVKHPIMLAGMNWVTQPRMVVAVSNAGALGNLAITGRTPDDIRKCVREIREKTDKPFAINQALLSPSAKKNLAVVIEEKIPIVNYTLGRPDDVKPLVEAVHKYGGKVIATVAVARHAASAQRLGVDGINITGHEAAAHGGFATLLVLIPLVAQAVKVPITAAGGFSDGRGLAAALALGADAITMGTRFAMTQESPLHQHWRDIIMKSTEQDTLYIDVGDPRSNERVYKNKKGEAKRKKGFPVVDAFKGVVETKKLLKLSWWELMQAGMKGGGDEAGSMGLKEQLRYAAHQASIQRVLYQGDEEAGTLPIGQGIGSIRDVPTCKELIERTVAEAEAIAQNVAKQACAK